MKKGHWIVLGMLLLVSLALELTLLAGYDSHWWNAIPGFYMIWGFLGGAAVILLAQGLGKMFILRDEEYYDR